MTAQTILPANSVRGGDIVTNSCIFDRASEDSMSRSMSDGSSIKSTFSAWVKVEGLGNEHNIMSHFEDTNNVYSIATSGAGVYINDYNDGYTCQVQTNRIMRDPSAWFHLCVIIDRSQATAGNRNLIFINGVQQTSLSSSTNYGQQTSGSHQDAISMNDGDCTLYIGQLGNGNQYMGGYLAEVVYLDGTAAAVTNFGEFDSDSGIWIPKDVSGLSSSKGTNGFYLNFEDSSNLGNDAFGGTDFSEANIAAANQTTDTCNNNFCVMNPLDNFYAGGTLAEGNLQVTTRNTGYSYNTATIGVATGKWYWEVKWSAQNTGNTNQVVIGIAKRPVQSATVWLGSVAWTYSYQGSDGKIKLSDSDVITYDTYSVGDIIGVALDMDNNRLYFSKNGTFQNSSNPADGTNPISITAPDSAIGDSGFYFPAFGDGNNNLVETGQFNFGNPIHSISSGNADADGHGNFEYAVPSGYFSLCSKNLAEYG